MNTGLILGLRPANERRHFKVMPSPIGWAQACDQPCEYDQKEQQFTEQTVFTFSSPQTLQVHMRIIDFKHIKGKLKMILVPTNGLRHHLPEAIERLSLLNSDVNEECLAFYAMINLATLFMFKIFCIVGITPSDNTVLQWVCEYRHWWTIVQILTWIYSHFADMSELWSVVFQISICTPIYQIYCPRGRSMGMASRSAMWNGKHVCLHVAVGGNVKTELADKKWHASTVDVLSILSLKYFPHPLRPRDANMAAQISVHTGSGDGLLPDGTKPLPEPMLTCHQWGPVTVTWGHLYLFRCHVSFCRSAW